MKAQSILFIISIIFIMSSCNDLQFSNPSSTAVVNFQRKYPGIESSKWSKDQEGHYEVQFEVEHEEYQADFGFDGKWIETINDIQFAELPNSVKQVLRENFDANTITSVKRIDHHIKGLHYLVEFKTSEQEIIVEIDTAGELLPEKTETISS